jgi:hypothetical protein
MLDWYIETFMGYSGGIREQKFKHIARHEFADSRAWLGIPNAGDVLSNAAFAVVGGVGLPPRGREKLYW